MLKHKGSIIAGVCVAGVFIYGIIHLFVLRFSAGDVYPYYSSLRSDPLGTKVFYASLQNSGATVVRNYEDFFKIKDDHNSAVLFLGLKIEDVLGVPDSYFENLDYFVRNGGRLVITLHPYNDAGVLGSSMKKYQSLRKNADEEVHVISTDTRWGYHLNWKLLPEDQVVEARSDSGERVSCHTAVFFDKLKAPWRVLYKRDNSAVIIERDLGKGSILLSALSYFVSNEAMIRERHPELLLRILAGRPKVIFDEYHNGIQLSPGIVALARRYDLQWLLLGFILLAGAYIWKNSLSLVPPFQSGSPVSLATGKDSAAAMTNLLRRSIPATKLLKTCYEEWKRSEGNRQKNKMNRIESVVNANADPVSAYNSIRTVLNERE